MWPYSLCKPISSGLYLQNNHQEALPSSKHSSRLPLSKEPIQEPENCIISQQNHANCMVNYDSQVGTEMVKHSRYLKILYLFKDTSDHTWTRETQLVLLTTQSHPSPQVCKHNIRCVCTTGSRNGTNVNTYDLAACCHQLEEQNSFFYAFGQNFDLCQIQMFQ